MVDDPELVRAVRSGDVAAFTATFDRYAARVHDLALAMLRDRGAALEVVESTFREASLRLHALQEDHRLAVWLLSVTRRNGALRAGPTAGADRQPSLPNDDPEQARLTTLVWEAVADLPLRERTLIDLDLRQGLDGQDLADALGVTLPQAQDLQRRMRDRIEKGLSGYLIARTAEGRCTGLTKVLKGWDGRFTPATSGRIAKHVDGCSVCNQIRFGLPSPFALYASALHAPFPAAARPRVLDGLVLPAVAPRDAPLDQAPPLEPLDAPWSSPYAPPQPNPIPAVAPPWSPTPADAAPAAAPAAAYPAQSGVPEPQPYEPVPPPPVTDDAAAYPPAAVTAAYAATYPQQPAAPPVHDPTAYPQAPSPAAYGATPDPEPAYEATPHPEETAQPAYDAVSYPPAPDAAPGYDITPYPEAPAYDATPYPETAAPPAYDATPHSEAPAAPAEYDSTPWLAEPAPAVEDANADPEAPAPSADHAVPYLEPAAQPFDDTAHPEPAVASIDDAAPWLAEPDAGADEATAHPEAPTPGADAGTPPLEAPATEATDDTGFAAEAPSSQSQVIATPAEPGALAGDDAPSLDVTGSAAPGATPADMDPDEATAPSSSDVPAGAQTATAPEQPHDAAEPHDQRPAPTTQETP